MSDFFDGTATPNTLYNLAQALQRRRTSYLAQAMGLDVELYEANKDKRRPKSNPDLVEFGLNESLLSSIHEVLQQIRDFTAGAKKAKVKTLPRPITAKQKYDRRRAIEAYEDVMSKIRFEGDGGD